ncbi:hypothetical protein E1A91_D09G220200v1 [Gossypium mustelinum]|uniref:Beta-amylase n=1 Tax=Gossypium mustelinum TaxID=34275 RepID=A0A5D2TMC3_GOSMU|nr:hypothetical protein E1A91_D09G220200v1 [Gossypium mustelinum]
MALTLHSSTSFINLEETKSFKTPDDSLATICFARMRLSSLAMNVSLMALKNAGLEGVMVDAWWGYAELVRMVEKHGLKLQVVMSFHQCGGNVVDSCRNQQNPDLIYTDRSGQRNPEYISLGCDSLPVLRGRTPIQVYTDYMRSFRERFRDYLGRVIVEIQVGLGPCGELRYPESNGTWKFPGIREFQCYDKPQKQSGNMTGKGGTHDSGHYKQFPEETGFLRRDGAWNTKYGQFFLEWILTAAKATFRGTETKLSGKVAGIHWHYRTRSHAAELTAGYYNIRYQDVFNFACLEMKDGEQPEYANCSPEGLVRQVKMATKTAQGELTVENALERISRSDSGNGLSAFTYLRMNKRLFQGNNWQLLHKNQAHRLCTTVYTIVYHT